VILSSDLVRIYGVEPKALDPLRTSRSA